MALNNTLNNNTNSFTSLKLNKNLLNNLDSLGYEFMTPIQSLSLPHILSGKDVIGRGKTGSGKTAAFGLGILQKLSVKSLKVQSLVLCPTRELADQVAMEIRKLARTTANIKILTLCGGTPLTPQIKSLEFGAHIVVGTPGRIEQHLRKKTLDLHNLTTLVLDEADRMLDMGFQDSIDNIIAEIPKSRQTLLFSATYIDEVKKIATQIMSDQIYIEAPEEREESTIKELFYATNSYDNRIRTLRILIGKYQLPSILVFCNTKIDTQSVANQLRDFGFYAVAINGDLEQKDRDQALIRFTNKSIHILVATDVAARGLDVDKLDLVINFNIAHDAQIHTHRIGRTGRAKRSGVAVTFFSTKEVHKLKNLNYDENITAGDVIPSDSYLEKIILKPLMTTIKIDGGKKQKIRPSDIVGALTKKDATSNITGDSLGKINISSNWSYIAISSDLAKTALNKLKKDGIKGKTFRARILF